jgi:histidinol-phosphate aminotransferase
VSRYWNERVRGLSPYIPGEQPRDRRFIKLNTNENPYPPSPRVLEALRREAGEALRLYPDPACLTLREAVAARYGVGVEQVFAGNGSDEVLAFVFAAFFESPGPPVLFPDITYSFYPVYAGLWGVPWRTIPLEDDFSVNPAAYRVPSGGVILANPNAPTGRALLAADLFSLADYLEQTGRVLVVDEAYAAFAGDAISAVSPDRPNLLTVHTLSKAASLAGLRAGFAIGNEGLIQGLCRVRDSFNSYTLDRLALAGAAAAVLDAPYYEEINRRVIATRNRVSAALTEAGIEVIPSSANFIFIRFPGKSGAQVFQTLRDRGILVRRFDKDRITDYLRVSIGAGPEMDLFLEECRNIQGRR